jgi:hypothetical protein
MTTKITTKYNRKNPLIGVTGKEHKSAAEAKASFYLFNRYSIIPCEDKFDQEFLDATGKKFRACPDFVHPTTGVFFEFKTKRMNGKKSKAAADQAMRKVEDSIANGWVDARKLTYKRLENAWNHSIHKVAAVAKQLPKNVPLVLLYESTQDLNEERRCVRNGVFMLSLDNLSLFGSCLKMASVGLNVDFKRNGFCISFKNL